MQERYGYVVGFIIATFFTISFLMTAIVSLSIVSLLNPVLTFEFVQVSPLFSWTNPITGCVVHITGNIFFAAVAIFFALVCWRKYNEHT